MSSTPPPPPHSSVASALTLAAALRHAFNCTVELRQPGRSFLDGSCRQPSTVAADLAFAMAAAPRPGQPGAAVRFPSSGLR